MSIPAVGTIRKIHHASVGHEVFVFHDLDLDLDRDDPGHSNNEFSVPQGDSVFILEVIPGAICDFRVKLLARNGKVGWVVAASAARPWEVYFVE